MAVVAAAISVLALALASIPDARGPAFAGYGFASPEHYLRYAADPASDPQRERHNVVTYSDSPSEPDVGDMVRSCRAARTFPVYALGARFSGNDLSDVTATCQVPTPPTTPAGRVRPGGQAATDLFYGPCTETSRGCSPRLDIRNRPARAEPHRRLHLPNTQLPHRDLSINGRRAAMWVDGGQTVIEMYFPLTTVTVRSSTALAQRAATHLQPLRP
jgi:hypothetical protein